MSSRLLWSWVRRAAIAACVLIIGFVLLAIPKVNQFRRFAADGAAKGHLGLQRQALFDFQKRTGRYPLDLSELGTAAPELRLMATPHAPSRAVRYAALSEASDSGHWLYDNRSGDPDFGRLVIDCSHTDRSGNPWSSY